MKRFWQWLKIQFGFAQVSKQMLALERHINYKEKQLSAARKQVEKERNQSEKLEGQVKKLEDGLKDLRLKKEDQDRRYNEAIDGMESIIDKYEKTVEILREEKKLTDEVLMPNLLNACEKINYIYEKDQAVSAMTTAAASHTGHQEVNQ